MTKFYTMKMREGINGVENPEGIKKLIESNLIGMNDDADGYKQFENLKSGDIVVVRGGGIQFLVEVTSLEIVSKDTIDASILKFS